MKEYVPDIQKQFTYYKSLGDKTFAQVSEEELFWQYNEDSNSIASIVKHIAGNMRSRWTDFFTSDGEKTWRHREQEFDNDLGSKEAMLKAWEDGWQILFHIIDNLKEEDLNRIIYIRNIGHTVLEAVNRQLAHYSYHIGQIVFLGKMLKGTDWQSLSIPRGQSSSYNAKQFAKPKHKGHFTDGTIEK